MRSVVLSTLFLLAVMAMERGAAPARISVPNPPAAADDTSDLFRPLQNMAVDIDGQPSNLGPVMLYFDQFVVPLRDAITQLSASQASLGVAPDKAWLIIANGHNVARIPSAANENDYKAVIYDADGKDAVRTINMADHPSEATVPGRGSTTMVSIELIAACLGVTVDTTNRRMSMYTPNYWCDKLKIDAQRSAGRQIRQLPLLPDFGISPPARTILFWVRPPAKSYVQVFFLGDAPQPLLAVDDTGGPVDIPDRTDEPMVRQASAADPIRAQCRGYGEDVGKVATYVALVLKVDIGKKDPIEAINSGEVPDDGWAVIGIRQRFDPMPVKFDTVLVKAGEEDPAKFAAHHNTRIEIVRCVNGIQPREKLKPGTPVSIISSVDDSALRTSLVASYKIAGQYEVLPGENAQTLSQKWGVTLDEFYAGNSMVPNGGDPDPGDLINEVRKRSFVPPPPNPNLPSERPVPFTGIASLTTSVDLRQSSQPGSATVGHIDKTHIVQVLEFMAAAKAYKVQYGDAMGYVDASVVSLRGAHSIEQSPGLDPGSSKVAGEAVKYLGTKYVWGGDGLTTGIDCSHFVAQVYQRIGWPVPAAPVVEQERIGDIVHFKPGWSRRNYRQISLPDMAIAPRGSSDINRLQPGDRIIFQHGNTDASGSRHTAIFIGRVPSYLRSRFGDIQYAFVHASCSRGVTISGLGEKYYWGIYHYSVRSQPNATSVGGDGFASAVRGK